jgi:hypothetical protein
MMYNGTTERMPKYASRSNASMELSIQKGRPKALPFDSFGAAFRVLSLEVSVDMRSP